MQNFSPMSFKGLLSLEAVWEKLHKDFIIKCMEHTYMLTQMEIQSNSFVILSQID